MGDLGGLHALSIAEVLAQRKGLVGHRNWGEEMHLTCMWRQNPLCEIFPASGFTLSLLKVFFRDRVAPSEEEERMWLEVSGMS